MGNIGELEKLKRRKEVSYNKVKEILIPEEERM